MKKIFAALIIAFYIANCAFADVQYKYLEKINEPKDIKEMTVKQLNGLAKDIRAGILNRTNLIGGHVGSDLGIVEVTIAMHYVFDSPKDKFIFDVSHQSYPHKMLTGRKNGFIDPLEHTYISGYTNPLESPHDFFRIGHTSTSVSLATGMAKARDLKGEKYNIIALIGDGSLSGGEAFEGFNNAAVLDSNFIIVINDNEMCIAENHGGLYKNLKLLRDTSGLTENNVFRAMGFEYYYVADGNNIQAMIDIFKRVKDTNKPTVVHVHTLKGKGYFPAEQNKEKYHWMLPGYLEKKPESVELPPESYVSLTKDYLLKVKKSDNSLVVITPATPGILDFNPAFRDEMGANYTDVGIAEQHAVAYASGIATNGGKPVLSISSSFIQRAYDQLSQDLAMNNSSAVILVSGYGISSADITHLGVFDIPLISNIPNIVYMAPVNKEEYLAILDWAVKQKKHPVAIRVPKGEIVSTGEPDKTDYSVLNKYKVVSEGKEIAIIAEGSFFELGRKLQSQIKEKFNIDATLINPVYLTGIDYDLLENLKKKHTLVITLEDGVLDGGFGEKISRFYSTSNIKVLNYGAQKEFTDRVPVEELYKRYHLLPELILDDIVEVNEMTDVPVETEVNGEGASENDAQHEVQAEMKNVPQNTVKPPAEEKPAEIKKVEETPSPRVHAVEPSKNEGAEPEKVKSSEPTSEEQKKEDLKVEQKNVEQPAEVKQTVEKPVESKSLQVEDNEPKFVVPTPSERSSQPKNTKKKSKWKIFNK